MSCFYDKRPALFPSYTAGNVQIIDFVAVTISCPAQAKTVKNNVKCICLFCVYLLKIKKENRFLTTFIKAVYNITGSG